MKISEIIELVMAIITFFAVMTTIILFRRQNNLNIKNQEINKIFVLKEQIESSLSKLPIFYNVLRNIDSIESEKNYGKIEISNIIFKSNSFIWLLLRSNENTVKLFEVDRKCCQCNKQLNLNETYNTFKSEIFKKYDDTEKWFEMVSAIGIWVSNVNYEKNKVSWWKIGIYRLQNIGTKIINLFLKFNKKWKNSKVDNSRKICCNAWTWKISCYECYLKEKLKIKN